MKRHLALLALLAVASAIGSMPSAQAEIPRYFEFADGKFRGGQPQDDADYQQLEDSGVETIISLRKGHEVEDEAAKIAAWNQAKGREVFKFISLPMGSLVKPKSSKIDAVIAALTDPANGKVFVHCYHGEDRTGLIVGMYRYRVLKWTQAEIYEEMKGFGFHDTLVGLASYYWSHSGGSRLKGFFKFAGHLINPFDGVRDRNQGSAAPKAEKSDDEGETPAAKPGAQPAAKPTAKAMPDTYGDDDGG